jgi:hypothetical protein
MQEICTIFVDTHDRINDLVSQFYASSGEERHTLESGPGNVKGFALERQERTTIEEAIAKLKQDLGKDDFKKLDLEFYKHCYVGTPAYLKLKYPETPDLGGKPNRCTPWENMEKIHHVPAQAPAVQP